QFTQPKRAATVILRAIIRRYDVSIHAAQGGCDGIKISRHIVCCVSIHAAQAGCDNNIELYIQLRNVSIHAAQAGCDIQENRYSTTTISFKSRSPSGLRPGVNVLEGGVTIVSIHAAQAGC
ncbi:hypothetical protein HMPREF9999_01557, partial [Alloprevotella sp. oral taxon 473 str. F0040]